jgi:uncharacterized membrane protein YfcA
MGVSGLMGHITTNNIDYLVLTVMGAAAMIGGYLGAKYTNQFSDKILKRNIGMIWVVVAITTFCGPLTLTDSACGFIRKLRIYELEM